MLYLAATGYTSKPSVRSTAKNSVFCSKQYPPRGCLTSLSKTLFSCVLMPSFLATAYATHRLHKQLQGQAFAKLYGAKSQDN